MSKIHTVIKTVDGAVVEKYVTHLKVKMSELLEKDKVFKSDIEDLYYYGSIKDIVGGLKVCYYYSEHNVI